MSSHYLGIAGLPAFDVDTRKYFLAYRAAFPDVSIPLGFLGHDAAAAVVKDGKILFAVEEERLNYHKHSMGMPKLAEAACLSAAAADIKDTQVSFYMNPTEEFLRQRVDAFRSASTPGQIDDLQREYRQVQKTVFDLKRTYSNLRFVDHHLAHAASVFYPSGFEDALILISDGFGEASSVTVLFGDRNGIRPLTQLPITSSLGFLYGRVTQFLGFESLDEEYKVMGLAAYGQEDEYSGLFDDEIRYEPNGKFKIPSLALSIKEVFRDWEPRLGKPRLPDEPIEPRHIGIAHSLQKAVERATLRLLEHCKRRVETKNLCIAGGVGQNCSMNGIIDRSMMFDRIFVQPASTDAGAAIGAALWSYFEDHPDGPRVPMEHAYLGPSFGDQDVLRALEKYSSQIQWVRPAEYEREVASVLAQGEIVGWFQGRMEFGPRALGNRSILADPRRPEMKDRVNQLVKKREEFRPFAPSVVQEAADEFFELRSSGQYGYMTIAVPAKPDRAHEIPAVVHVNGTARVQVVRKEVNPRYWNLITEFGKQTGVALVLNTSFNVKGQVIVQTPEDALLCFLDTDINCLALDGYLVRKKSPKNLS